MSRARVVRATLWAGFFTNGVWDMLSVAVPLYGAASGLSPAAAHGASVGVRNAVTRLASIVTPAIMGIAAEAWGVETSFYAVGAVLLLGIAVLTVMARSLPRPR